MGFPRFLDPEFLIGLPFPQNEDTVGDCPSMGDPLKVGFDAFCTLNLGHEGPHVAGDGERIVAAWGD